MPTGSAPSGRGQPPPDDAVVAFPIGGGVVRAPRAAVEVSLGATLALCGGTFMTTIAALEAVAAAGVDRVIEKFARLWQSASSPEGLTEPMEVYGLLLAAVAAIRSHLARAVVFGCAAGDTALRVLQPRAEPLLRSVVPAEHHRNIPGFSRAVCQLTGVLLAWRFQRHVSAVQWALRGRTMVEQGLVRALGPHRRQTAVGVSWAVAGLGVALQLRRDFRPLSLFFGLSLFESALTQAVMAL
eukprot:EG_transcript_20304